MGYMGHLAHIYSVWPLLSERAELRSYRSSDEGRVFKDEACTAEVIQLRRQGRGNVRHSGSPLNG